VVLHYKDVVMTEFITRKKVKFWRMSKKRYVWWRRNKEAELCRLGSFCKEDYRFTSLLYIDATGTKFVTKNCKKIVKN
jgi:CCR4-NOT transcriptional regulation complex NOT5 subunit